MFHKIGGFFTKLFGGVPSWTQKASAAISYAAPLLTGILALTTGPEYSEEVGNIVAETQSDLALAAALVSGAHGTGVAPAGLQSSLQSVKDNLTGLLAAGHIKNPATLTKVTAVVGLVNGELDAILQNLPKPATAPTIVAA
ncbi:MAG: hypothetical protein ACJ71W_22010 [Terriglobales bacterium]